jgi:hypothetical protein
MSVYTMPTSEHAIPHPGYRDHSDLIGSETYSKQTYLDPRK